MIRSAISRLLLALLPGRAVAAIGDLLAEELRAGWAREDALEGALEQALRDAGRDMEVLRVTAKDPSWRAIPIAPVADLDYARHPTGICTGQAD